MSIILDVNELKGSASGGSIVTAEKVVTESLSAELNQSIGEMSIRIAPVRITVGGQAVDSEVDVSFRIGADEMPDAFQIVEIRDGDAVLYHSPIVLSLDSGGFSLSTRIKNGSICMLIRR